MSTDVIAPEAEHPAFVQMLRELAVRTTELGDRSSSTDEFILGILEGILSADNFDEIFAAQNAGGISGQDFTGRPFTVESAEDIEWIKSTQTSDDGRRALPVFARLKVTELATNEELTISCGGMTFVTTLWALYTKDYFSQQRALSIVEKKSPAGAYLQLVPVRREPASKRAK